MIKLQPFNESDFRQLIDEIPDARFLLQWAGPKYSYPLDAAQLNATLGETNGEVSPFKVYKAIRRDTSEIVGHIQLMNIDYNSGTCVLGRVMIFRKFRGNGYGKAMVCEAITVAFEKLKLMEITLKVFDFNTSAIELYKGLGFSDYRYDKGICQFQNEKWNVFHMRLKKDRRLS